MFIVIFSFRKILIKGGKHLDDYMRNNTAAEPWNLDGYRLDN